MHPITDPYFYLVAIPAIILTGFSKGGLGGGIALIAVPLMSLTISPVQAAGILLPILVIMDIVGLLSYRGNWDSHTLKLILPASTLGIIFAWMTAAYVTDAHIRLIIGSLSLYFILNHWLKRKLPKEPKGHNPKKALLWGGLSGFTSFISHAGGPPYQMYTLPLQLPPVIFAGTSVLYFSIVNALKLIPYFIMGQFDSTNLSTSIILLPFAPLATYAGYRIVKRINQKLFYKITYTCLFVVSIKLIHDGIEGLFAG
ncbi:sulfite exporter TauE/SafE family protein [Polycladidibacter stylochi]|uniref:sulfite exporter TauE/SafE family protein n=1 Tax=Polycladidibacter stylochi TaxID=1807766 RepID=UPI0008366FC4|nr:sulfite exporter TauE/SafE family protein [Pseudovibrio stylochi]